MHKLFLNAFLIIIPLLGGAAAPIQEKSLLHSSWTRYSQSGEEGILDEILDRMEVKNGFFIEFGALDGLLFSNTRFLAEQGWKGVFIETDPSVVPKLFENCQDLPNLLCLDEFVASNSADPRGKTLDALADIHFPDQEIDVLSIDIDGEDYLIFESLKRKPKVICIESSGYWHPSVQIRIPDDIAKQNLGQPLPIIIESAKMQGYVPVCFLVVNLFLVRQDYAHLFSEIKNDPYSLWFDSWNFMGQHYPNHQRYISHAREVSPNIRNYDPYPTPPLDVSE